MRLGKRRVLLCSCEDTMTLDGPRLAESLEAEGAPQLCRQLCRSEIATLLEAARDSEDGLLVACTQEGLTFQEQLEAAQPVGERGNGGCWQRASLFADLRVDGCRARPSRQR